MAGIEACYGSHYRGRELIKPGHTVRLLPAQYVKPFVVGGKNDANDAAAICMAVSRRDIHTVPVKSAEQQSLHRMRGKAIQEKTEKSIGSEACSLKRGIFSPRVFHLYAKGLLLSWTMVKLA